MLLPLAVGVFARNLSRIASICVGVAAATVLPKAWSQAPANDNFSNAQVLTSTTDVFTATGNNVGATGEPGEQSHGSSYATASSIWFAWIAPADGAIVVDTIGSATTASHAIYTGTTLANLNRIAQDSTSSLASFDKLPVTVTGGTTYYIGVGSRFDQNDRGFIGLRLVFSTAPSITAQPSDRTANPGDSITFSVSGSGPTPAYQWYRNGIAISGATTAVLSLANVQVADGGTYHVVVSNAAGAVVSSPVLLRGANPPPSVTLQPASRLATAGETVSFSATGNGIGPVKYQWRRNGIPISGATGANLTFAPVSRSDIDLYDVRVNDGLSVTYSDRVRLDVQPSATPTGFGLDASFNVSLEIEGGSVAKLRRAPDGKILLAGNFPHYDGATKPNLARLNANGSVDTTFVGAAFDAAVSDVALQSDGKLIVVGSFAQIDNLSRSFVARLNADGTPDATFVVEPVLSVRAFYSVVLQTDGKILVAGDVTATAGSVVRSNLFRLLPNGALDAAYSPNPGGAVRSLALQPDGKLLVVGSFTTIGGVSRRYLTRLNLDGTNDAAFDPGTGPGGATTVVKLIPDGRLLVSGAFSQFNGASAPGLIRLLADGTRDPAFVGVNATGFVFGSGATPADGSINDLVLLADGKLVAVGSFQFLNGGFVSGSYGFARLQADGSPDYTFVPDALIAGGVSSILALDDGRLLLGGAFQRFVWSKPPGGVAAFFPTGKHDPLVRGTFATGSAGALALVTGGKILVAGAFSRVNGVARDSIARLNSDGSLDPAFSASPNDFVSDLAVQGDGRIVITGAFTSIAGVARNGLARLNADGTLDASLNFRDVPIGGGGADLRVVSLAEGRVLLAGSGVSSFVQNRHTFARLHADGSLDTGFVPFADASVGGFIFSDFAVLPDERVLYSNDGSTSSNGIKPAVLGRLAQDGRLDAAFTPGVVPTLGSGVRDLSLMPDGKILIGGSFTTYNGTARNRLARLLPDGAVDPAFVPNLTSTTPISRLLPARDGLVYVFRGSGSPGAEFALATSLSRLTAALGVDTGFLLSVAGTRTAGSPVLLLDDGNLLIAGSRFTEGSVTRAGLIRTRAISGAAILTQPVATTLFAGAGLSLAVSAGGASNFTYQWFKDGAPIQDAARSVYSVTAAQATAAGVYFVRVFYTGGSIDSVPVTVTVNESPPLFAAPSPVPVGFGSTMQAGTCFALNAPALSAGSAPLSYQWSKDGIALPGETGSALFRGSWALGDTGAYRVTITNSLGTVTSGVLWQAVTKVESWTWVSPQPQGNSLTGVQYLGGIFLAGAVQGAVLRSVDGFNWTAHHVAGSATIGPFAYGNGRFVALSAFGGILTCVDGATWRPRESGLTDGRSLTQVAFGDGRFAAVGTRGTVLVSTDGSAWASASIPTTDSLNGVAYGNGRWLAISSRSRVFSSIDGMAWESITSLPDLVSALAFGAGMFVATGANAGTVFTSSDGATWATRSFAVTNAAATSNLQSTPAGFLSSISSSTGRYLASTDGTTWAERSIDLSLSTLPSGITFGGGRYVMAVRAPDLLLTSLDGIAWSRVSVAESREFRAIAANGSAAVAVGVAQPALGFATSSLIYSSNDGATWTARSLATIATLNDIACGVAPTGAFVAVGASGVIATSPDGAAWTLRTSGTSQTLRGVKQVNGRFLAVGDGGVMLSSPDGADWSMVMSGVSPALYQIAYGAGIHVAVGAGGTILTSNDPLSFWVSRVSGVSATLVDVVYAAGRFVAVGSTGEIVTSADGIAWTSVASHADALNGVVFAGGAFCAFGTASSYYTSIDGESWTDAQHGSVNALNDAVEFKSQIIGVGRVGSILAQRVPPAPGGAIPVILAQPLGGTVHAGGSTVLSVASTGTPVPDYQWLRNGAPIPGATGASFAIVGVQPLDAGFYAVTCANSTGNITSSFSALGVVTSDKVIGAGVELQPVNIPHPNGNTFDQVLVTGAAETITADQGQVTRTSFIDLNDNIVQVEFTGAGSLSLVLDNPAGPATPVNYNQAVNYMKGHAGIVVTGANETTNLAVFSVGRVSAFDPTGRFDFLQPISATNNPANNGSSLFVGHAATAYDGRANIAFIAIASANGRFGGLRASNAICFATRGPTGIYAPGVQFTGPVFVGDINAYATATPVFLIGSSPDTRITGGDLLQANAQPVRVAGLTELKFTAGATSNNAALPAQANKAVLVQIGADVTAQIVVNPSP